MSTWENIFLAIVIATLLFVLFKGIKRQPGAFSKDNLVRSLGVLGILALCLILFIALLINIVR